jgi:hypothetical protein
VGAFFKGFQARSFNPFFRVCDKNVGAIFLTETYPPFGKGGQGGFAIKA